MIRGSSPPHPHDVAAANRTLPSDKTLPTQLNSHKHHFRSGFTYSSLQRLCPSASVTIPNFPVASSSLGRNLAPAFCKAHAKKLQVLVHCLETQVSVPKSAQLSFPPTRVFLMSPLITKRCNHSVGVAMCLMRPAPLRIAMARPAVASSLISRLGLSIPSPNPFALTSTPCCCKNPPRSRTIETQPIPAAAALTAA